MIESLSIKNIATYDVAGIEIKNLKKTTSYTVQTGAERQLSQNTFTHPVIKHLIIAHWFGRMACQ
jgi:hypothetical protein